MSKHEEPDKKEKQTKGISRRDFILGSAAGIAGTAITGVLSGCAPKSPEVVEEAAGVPEVAESAPEVAAKAEPWYGSAPEIADSDIVEEVDTEILICGAGHTGMIAAIVAAEQGAETLVIEKNESVGTVRSYVGAVNSKAQLDAGAEIDKNEIMLDMARYGSNHVDQGLIRVWIDESAETVEWLADVMAEYGIVHVSEYDVGTGYHGVYKCWPTHTLYHDPSKTIEENPDDITSTIEEKAREGAEFRLSTPMVKLVQDGGKVTGAIAKNPDGKYIKINASKGVLLCTGGYASDPELYAELNPCAASVTTFSIGQPGTTGDGIKAGIWAGGVKDLHPAAMLFDRGIAAPGSKAGIPYVGRYFRLGSQPFMKVNMDGERYCCESTPYDFCLYPLEHEKNAVFNMIWDANYWEHIESFHTMGCSRLVLSSCEPQTFQGIGKEALDAELTRMMDGGLVVKANTLEELAEALMIPPAAFKATVQRYNQMAAAGVDEDFGKPAKDLLALDTPPYYGATFGANLLTTMDGLRINTDMQVLDADFDVVEGLYAAGDVAGGFFAHNYPELAVGIACGKSMTFGRHAVLHMLGKK